MGVFGFAGFWMPTRRRSCAKQSQSVQGRACDWGLPTSALLRMPFEASAVGGAEMHLVRAVGFAKTDVGNWGVPWHQDRVISVSERRDVPGYGNWSCKRGVWHCEPPVRNLQRMTFLRVFLDEVTPDNGGMEYAVGSHAAGRVADSEAVQMARKFKVEVEEAGPGDVLVLHMLTLHRSSPSLSHLPRRVLRVDAAGFDLPAPLQWAERIQRRISARTIR